MGGDDICSREYATPPGDPCVPAVSGDLRCRDLAQWGVSEARVIGTDVYGFDVDGDGVGCETNIPASATTFGDAVASVAPLALVGSVILVAIVLVGPVRRAVRFVRDAAMADRRRVEFASAWIAFLTVLIALVAVFLFATFGIER
jgi:hypothetical protein